MQVRKRKTSVTLVGYHDGKEYSLGGYPILVNGITCKEYPFAIPVFALASIAGPGLSSATKLKVKRYLFMFFSFLIVVIISVIGYNVAYGMANDYYTPVEYYYSNAIAYGVYSRER